jgi:hypothetical protein
MIANMQEPPAEGFGYGSLVCLRRDDGSDATLLRQRPTSSRAADAFVVPKVVLTAADRLTYLKTVSAEGAAFARVLTGAGIEGYVSLKYVVAAPPSASAAHSAHPHAHHALAHKPDTSGHAKPPVKGKSGTGFAKPQDTGAGAAPAPFGRAAPAPFHFDVEWIELWSATKGSSYFNTKRSTSQTQRPICFPSSAPLHQSPIALRAKSIVHPAFLRKSPSPKPSAAACFIDPEEPAAAAAAAAASPAAAMARPSPPQQTFPDFFACLQKHRSQLGGDRFAASVPEMKRYTGACICDDVLARA